MYQDYANNLKGKKEKMINVQEAQFPTFDLSDNDNLVPLEQNNRRHMELLMDVPVNIRVQVGKTKRTMRDIMKLEQGSVIQLNKQAGAPVDVIANDQLIARGDVIVTDDKFSVRLTEISTNKIISSGK
ncbi:MAG: flagellar motor switch protein FliN [Oscillospiraceae bacterium]|nr:flagellar motor switch protein FliN [Oscillospiraceae bacterium]